MSLMRKKVCESFENSVQAVLVHRLHAFTISIVLTRILFIVPALFGTDIIQPAFIIIRTAVLIRNGSWSSHFVKFAAFRSVAKAFISELLCYTPVVFNRHIRWFSTICCQAFCSPDGHIPSIPVLHRSKGTLHFHREPALPTAF